MSDVDKKASLTTSQQIKRKEGSRMYDVVKKKDWDPTLLHMVLDEKVIQNFFFKNPHHFYEIEMEMENKSFVF
jgi:hypothetical protein